MQKRLVQVFNTNIKVWAEARKKEDALSDHLTRWRHRGDIKHLFGRLSERVKEKQDRTHGLAHTRTNTAFVYFFSSLGAVMVSGILWLVLLACCAPTCLSTEGNVTSLWLRYWSTETIPRVLFLLFIFIFIFTIINEYVSKGAKRNHTGWRFLSS